MAESSRSPNPNTKIVKRSNRVPLRQPSNKNRKKNFLLSQRYQMIIAGKKNN